MNLLKLVLVSSVIGGVGVDVQGLVNCCVELVEKRSPFVEKNSFNIFFHSMICSSYRVCKLVQSLPIFHCISYYLLHLIRFSNLCWDLSILNKIWIYFRWSRFISSCVGHLIISGQRHRLKERLIKNSNEIISLIY